MTTTIDIVIPVLNESKTLELQIGKLQEFLKDQGHSAFSHQITIADNGSTDSTLDIANVIALRYSNVRAVSVGRRGVGLALKEAWTTSTCDYIGYMDLDFSTNLRHLREVEQFFAAGYDCVFGSRLLTDSVVTGRTLKREVTSKVFNTVIRLIFRSSLSDGMCGFKFLQRDLLERFFEMGANCDGWFFGTEIVVVADLAKCRIHEIPVTWQDDLESKVKIPSLTLEYLKDILEFKIRIKKARMRKGSK